MIEENEENREFVERMSEGNDIDMEQMLQTYPTAARPIHGKGPRDQVRMLECGIRWAVEAKGKKEEAQRKSKAGKSPEDTSSRAPRER